MPSTSTLTPSITPIDNSQNTNVPPSSSMISLSSQLANGSGDIQKVLGQLINFNDEVLHEPTCIICASPYREEIETEWTASKKNAASVKKIIKQKMNIVISKDIILNHMLYHLAGGVKEIQKVEYANRIQRQLSVTKLTTIDRIELCFAALNERLVGINSITSSDAYNEADIEKIKSGEVTKIMSSFNNLLKLYTHLTGEMQKSGEFIMIPQRAFIKFITDSLAEAKDDNEKKIIYKLLENMKDLAQTT